MPLQEVEDRRSPGCLLHVLFPQRHDFFIALVGGALGPGDEDVGNGLPEFLDFGMRPGIIGPVELPAIIYDKVVRPLIVSSVPGGWINFLSAMR